MNEQYTEKRRELWYDGPNYTADSIIIHPESSKILLIRRPTGEWAFPAGFVDTSEQPLDAAIREVKEETSVDIAGDATLVFRGIVEDPRNSEDAWIETSAYLFLVDHTDDPRAGDDAIEVDWKSLHELPDLYASHSSILDRARDHLSSRQLFDIFTSPDTATRIDAGHMEYNKSICKKNNVAAFAKQHEFEHFDDVERANRSYHYLEKEAFTMAHLRQHDFRYVPDRSALYGNTLAMDALQVDDGWKWRADPNSIDAYITDSLEALDALEAIPTPADSFPINPSYESFSSEGWRALTDEIKRKLEQRFVHFSPRLTDESRHTAHEMMQYIDDLQRIARTPRDIPHIVFCHHDVRQSNLAWHPDHGTKLVDWSWAGLGETGSDQTSFLIDLHKGGHDISAYRDRINPQHCLKLMGFWLTHSTWPMYRDDTVRFQQFLSAISAYKILRDTP